jgi:hypothetical protein
MAIDSTKGGEVYQDKIPVESFKGSVCAATSHTYNNEALAN